MRRLRIRRAIRKRGTEERRERARLGRWIYLALVVIFFSWLINLWLGPLFFLRADGIVMRRSVVVATEFQATVVELSVQAGDRVNSGDVVAIIRSEDVVRDIANIALKLSRLDTELAQLRVRQNVLETTEELTETRLREALDMRDSVEELATEGLATQNRKFDVLQLLLKAQEDRALIAAEREALETQIPQLLESLNVARAALADLRNIYADGIVKASRDGIVGALDVEIGSVMSPGQQLMRIYTGTSFIVGFVPTGTFYDVKIGLPVMIHDGVREFPGHVSNVLPIASDLPVEFRFALGEIERKRSVEVTFDKPDHAPPLFGTVRLTGRSRLSGWLNWFTSG